MPHPNHNERTRRLDVLAGMVFGPELVAARAGVRMAVERHRVAQARAASPHASEFDRKPARTRQDVRDAIARLRAVEAKVVATYGPGPTRRAAARAA